MYNINSTTRRGIPPRPFGITARVRGETDFSFLSPSPQLHSTFPTFVDYFLHVDLGQDHSLDQFFHSCYTVKQARRRKCECACHGPQRVGAIDSLLYAWNASNEEISTSRSQSFTYSFRISEGYRRSHTVSIKISVDELSVTPFGEPS